MGFEVSRRTAARIKAVLAQGQRLDPGRQTGGGTARYDTHVRITAAEPDANGLWPCAPCYYDPVNEAWVEFDEQKALSVNDVDLEEGARYRAICYGKTGDSLEYLLFAVDALCVDAEKLAGDGLEVEDDSSSSCDKLKVKPGCHIEVDANGVHVDVDELPGDGLKVQEEVGCDKLAVDYACGLRITEDGKLALDLEAIAFDGLYGDNDICALGVNVGCGLGYVAEDGEEKIQVDVASLAGCGLVVDGGSSSGACPSLAVDTVPDATKDITLTVLVDAIAGVGCGISYTTKEVTFKRNSCGVVIDIVEGSPQAYSLDLSACCDCSSSDPPSSEDCAGWYCCEATGAVIYAADCETVAAYVCGGSGCESAASIALNAGQGVSVTAEVSYSHWYKITLAAGTTYKIVFDVSAMPGGLPGSNVNVYRDCTLGSAVLDTLPSACVSFTTSDAGDYIIRVEGYEFYSGSFTFEVQAGSC